MASAGLPEMFSIPWIAMTNTRKVLAGPASDTPELLGFIIELAAAGKFKSVIDRSYPLERIAKAYDNIGRRHKKGNVVITL